MRRLALLLLVHSFYSTQCCSDRDCHPVPCREISPIKDGWNWHGVFFAKGNEQLSPDGGCHVCVHGDKAFIGECIYLPPET